MRGRRVDWSAGAAAMVIGAVPWLHGAAMAQGAPATAAPTVAAAPCPATLNHTFRRLQDDQPLNLCQFAGRVVLVVNTASYCGFTTQFEGLEALNARYAARGLVVVGVPSNDFQQEDADAKKTADVCFNTYGVKFPMTTTTPVRGAGAHPMFRQLAQATGQAPAWNFNKYLIGRDGKPVAHFASTADPTGQTLVAAVERALQASGPKR